MALVALDIPELLAGAISSPGRELSRTALEAIALEAYRERRLSTSQLRSILGFSECYELDGFLKAHEVWLDYGPEDLAHDRETHRNLVQQV